MMYIYFVRHGETRSNNTQIHQGPHDELTEVGQAQAANVALKLKQFPIEFIVSSNFIRARKTTEIINKTLHKGVAYTDLFREVLQPSRMQGLGYRDPESLRVREQIRSHAVDASWHYSDEENFADYSQRAKQALELLTQYSYNNLLVVTHGTFLKVVMGVMLFGDSLTFDQYFQIARFFDKTNTGITIVETTDEADHPWRLKTWNDFAHLSEIS